MRRFVLLLALSPAALAWPGNHAVQPASSGPPAHWTAATRRVVLANGLTVLLLQRGELPIVSVQAHYRVGSRNESPGLTGAAHFVEHMAFRRTEGIAKQDLTNQVLRWGGRWNGYTSYDQTVYASHAPSRYLDWLILLERERMRRVVFDPDDVERERTSVISELRQYEDSPAYVMVEHRLRRVALIAHPYGTPIMGDISDLRGVTTAELQRFYREHYAPNNLILAIVGRFDEDQALGLVRRHFGDITGDGRPTRVRTIEPEQRGPRRLEMAGVGSASHLEMLFHAPAAGDDAFATLLVTDAVLAGGKAPGGTGVRSGSPLHRALVESGPAASVTAGAELSEYPGLYAIGASAAADADLDAVEAAIGRAIEDLQKVTAAGVERAAGQVRAAMTFAADSNRAIANLLPLYEQMGSYELLAELPQRLAGVTPEMVREFARTRLGPDRRTVGRFVPAGASKQTTPGAAATPPAPSAALPPPPRDPHVPPPDVSVPDLPDPATRRLPNGLTATALQLPGQVVHVRMRIGAGAAQDPPGREGLAIVLARTLRAGAKTRAGDGLAGILDSHHVRLRESARDLSDPAGNRSYVEISATVLPGSLQPVIDALAAMVREPALAEAAVRTTIRGLEAEVEAQAADSDWRAGRAMWERLYADGHPMGRQVEGTSASRARITQADVRAFHARHVRPEAITVAVAGSLPPDRALAAIASAFDGWKPGAAPEPSDRSRADTGPGPRAGRVHVPLDKAQASLAVGLRGVARDAPEYPALAALNYLLGETGYAGRLGEVLVDTGLAYAVYATVHADRSAGPIIVTTHAEASGETARRILATLDSFAKRGVTEAELREAKGFLLGRLPFGFESAEAASATLADLAWLGQAGDLRRFAERVRALTVDDLNRAAAKFYDPAKAVIAIAGR